MSRCTQQDALYRSEEEAPNGIDFHDLGEVKLFVKSMTDSTWWHERFPKVRGIRVERALQRDGSVGAWFEDDWTGQIEMSPAHWCAKYVCHEVAHVTAEAHAGSTSHDPAFVRDYLILVYQTLGSAIWMDLRQRLLDGGIVIDSRDDT